MTSVVVAQLYRVIHDGIAYPPGAIATVPDDVAQRWLTAGLGGAGTRHGTA